MGKWECVSRSYRNEHVWNPELQWAVMQMPDDKGGFKGKQPQPANNWANGVCPQQCEYQIVEGQNNYESDACRSHCADDQRENDSLQVAQRFSTGVFSAWACT